MTAKTDKRNGEPELDFGAWERQMEKAARRAFAPVEKSLAAFGNALPDFGALADLQPLPVTWGADGGETVEHDAWRMEKMNPKNPKKETPKEPNPKALACGLGDFQVTDGFRELRRFRPG